MIIKNFKSLSTTAHKKIALSIVAAGLEAADPLLYLKKIVQNDHLLFSRKKIDLKKFNHVYIVAVGKAAYLMSKYVNSLTDIDGGILVVPYKTRTGLNKNFKTIRSGHPLPDKNSCFAAKKIIDFLEKTKPDDFIIFLISGGASSLIALPDGITLKEKRRVTDLLLKCGATIRETNCIRKHLSKIKGGKLVEHLKSEAVSLVMSDVVGDDLSSIASGLTYFDNTGFREAKQILKRYHLEKLIPKNVLRHINLGIRGKISETPKKEKIRNYIISNNKTCLWAMITRAKDLGLSTKMVGSLSGDVKGVGAKLAKKFSDDRVNCLIFGGEPTVVVKGKGKGGRNQELVLHTSFNLAKKNKKAVVISVGTDGIDGQTDSAGAIWETNLETDKIDSFLINNDSHNFFKKYGGIIFTGPTGTNLMDIGLILRI